MSRKKYFGKVEGNKVIYYTPKYNALSGGNWQTGFSRSITTGGERIEYEIGGAIGNLSLSEDKWQDGDSVEFTLVNDKAYIMKIKSTNRLRFKSDNDMEKQINAYFEKKVEVAVVKASSHLHGFWAKNDKLHRMDLPLPGGVFYCAGVETFNDIITYINSTL